MRCVCLIWQMCKPQVLIRPSGGIKEGVPCLGKGVGGVAFVLMAMSLCRGVSFYVGREVAVGGMMLKGELWSLQLASLNHPLANPICCEHCRMPKCEKQSSSQRFNGTVKSGSWESQSEVLGKTMTVCKWIRNQWHQETTQDRTLVHRADYVMASPPGVKTSCWPTSTNVSQSNS